MRRWRRRDWFRVQAVAAAAFCGAALVFAVPNLARGETAWPSRQIPLEIDLVGETTLLIEPNWRPVYHQALRALRDEVGRALRDDRIRFDNLRAVAGGLRFSLAERADAKRVSKILAQSSLDWYPTPLQTLPGIAIRISDRDVFVSLTVAGREALHEASLSTAILRLHRDMKRLGADYRLSREGDRLRLVVRRAEALDERRGHWYRA